VTDFERREDSLAYCLDSDVTDFERREDSLAYCLDYCNDVTGFGRCENSLAYCLDYCSYVTGFERREGPLALWASLNMIDTVDYGSSNIFAMEEAAEVNSVEDPEEGVEAIVEDTGGSTECLQRGGARNMYEKFRHQCRQSNRLVNLVSCVASRRYRRGT